MAKSKATSSKADKRAHSTLQAGQPSLKSSSKGKERVKASDELRQAVNELGGDEEDLELIEGVDSDNEHATVPKTVQNLNDRDLKKQLGDFMKGLDFGAVSTFAVEPDKKRGGNEKEDAAVADNTRKAAGREVEEEEEEEEEENSDSDEGDEEESEDEGDDGDDDSVVEDAVDRDAAETRGEKPIAPAAPSRGLSQNHVPVDPNQSSGTIVPAAPIWASLLPPLPPINGSIPFLPPSKLSALKSKATTLLDNLPPLSRAGSSSDAAFISQILTGGTHQDKLSALVLLVRESPIHAVKELGRLRNMTGWKEGEVGSSGGNKDQRVAVMKALTDWWISGGGKEHGKLRYFADQPLLPHPELTDRHLVVFAFEDYLKKWFFSLLQVLEVLSHDILPFIRTQTLHMVFQLLSGNAEQEQNLLRLGVNKLGDTDRSVASKTSHHILQLLQVHPAMKTIVAREVSALVLKPTAHASAAASGTSHVRFDQDPPKKQAEPKSDPVSHARYYGLLTLNQITLTPKDQEVAGKLVELYFEVFREVVGESMKQENTEEEDADPDAAHVEKIAGKVEKWRGRKKGAQPKGGRKTALESESLVETGEARLIAAVLTGINRALPYAKIDDALFTTYMDTLFRITHAGTFNTSIQALQLIFQVCQSRQAVSDRFYRTLYDSLFDNRLMASSKQALYLNLLFKAMKADSSLPRVMAFVKRLLQMLGLHQPPFICGALYLLGELFNITPGLKRMLLEPEDDGEEHFLDAPEDGTIQTKAESSKSPRDKVYDGKKREPQYANADSSCLWELLPFVHHFHPTVSLQASQLLDGTPLAGSADISLNTLVSFLDRFVYRNPKKQLQPKGASIMQPAASSDTSGMVYRQKGARTGESGFVNSESFWRKKIEDVPVDQLFFQKYFSSRLISQVEGKKKRRDDDDVEESDLEDEEISDEDDDKEDALESDDADEDDEDDEEGEAEDSDPEEAEIWRVMQATMPGAEDLQGISADSDSDDELDMSDEGDDDDLDIGSDVDEIESEEEDMSEEDEEEGSETSTPEPVPQRKKKSRLPTPPSSDDEFPGLQDEEEDLIPMDETPDIQLDATPSADEDDNEEAKAKAGKRKRADERKERRKKRKEMPMFGSYEDYAALIEAGGNEGDD